MQTLKNFQRLPFLHFQSNSLFSTSKGKICITTPIFYVNSEPHIGHLYSMIYTDAIAKWKRIDGYNVIFSTGTDEHGQKIQNAAKAKGVSEIEHCTFYADRFKDLAGSFDVNYDVFIRTTEERHKKAVQNMWEILFNGGYITKDKHEGWYCVAEETFVAPKDLVADPKQPDRKITTSGYPVEWVSEESYKFMFSKLKEHLSQYFYSNPVKPSSYIDYLMSEGKNQNDISVSRPKNRIRWGIEVPNDISHTIYVWLDALTNYLTVINYPGYHNEAKDFEYGSKLVHVIGKDILKFHAIYWPAFLMAANLPTPHKVIVHNHWLKDNRKMSKSLGNVVEPFSLVDTVGINPVRYYFLLEGPEDFDANFEIEELVNKYNDFIQGFINVIMRITSAKILKNQTIEKVDWVFSDSDIDYIDNVNNLVEQCRKHYENYDIRGALGTAPRIWDLTNKLTTMYEPWKLKNDDSQRNKVIYLVLESVRIMSILLYPSLNGVMKNVNGYMGIDEKNINTENLKFRLIDNHTKGDLKTNFSYEENAEHFLKINLDKRETVFQNKLEIAVEQKEEKK